MKKKLFTWILLSILNNIFQKRVMKITLASNKQTI